VRGDGAWGRGLITHTHTPKDPHFPYEWEDRLLYAIVRTGGKQYKVAEKMVFTVEKLEVNAGDTVELTDVLMIGDGDNVKVVAGAKVTAIVLETAKGRKIKGFTYKKTKNVQRHYGHRQWHTRLRVQSIEG
jgi:large subunit ribosomal protein L21